MTGVVTAIAAGVTAVSTVMGVMEQKDANYQQRVAAAKEAEASQKRADIQNVRNIRQQLRERRLLEGQMQNVGAQIGATGSSALAGGVSSLGAQTASNISYVAQIAEQNTAIANAQLQGASVTSNAAVWGAVGSLAGTIFSGMDGFKRIGGALSKPTTPTS